MTLKREKAFSSLTQANKFTHLAKEKEREMGERMRASSIT
jgi:hypothetical protein